MQGVGRGSATMTKAADDAQLIKRVATRDENALRTLFTRHQVPVFRYIVRLVRNDAVAEELTNEVFLDVWRNAPNFEDLAAATVVDCPARDDALPDRNAISEAPRAAGYREML